MVYFVFLPKCVTLNFRAAKEKEVADYQKLFMEEKEKSEALDCFCGS